MSREGAYRILILGGYGHFGGRIVRTLAARADCHLIVAGRDLARTQQAAQQFASMQAVVEGMTVDAEDPRLAEVLRRCRVNLVIHTAGPFQGQSYHVARACIEAGANYVDLADGREFVCGIDALDVAARERGVLVISGASTVPALSAAVIDHYRHRFEVVDEIAIGITPGNQTPRGLSTIQSVLSYCGRPFTRWQEARWTDVFGWQDLHRVHYPALGSRWFSNCDVPDHGLLPRRYAVSRTVKFHAGLELSVIQISLWLMSWLSRWRVVRSWLPAAPALKRASEWLMGLGTNAGGMHVYISGRDAAGRRQQVRWMLTALNGDGPQIPCVASIVLACKLADGRLPATGARPCLDLMTLAEFDAAVRGLAIRWEEEQV